MFWVGLRNCLGLAVGIGAAGVTLARAEDQIGSAISVIKDVNESHAGRTAPLKVGEQVVRNQIITTAPASQARLEFLDRTELQIAPVSSVKLDSFVYDPASGAKQVVVNTTAGAFRFVSGFGHNYTVKTPTATLGIRGTAFAVRVSPQKTDVVLYNGEVSVCSNGGGRCASLVTPCTFVTATKSGVSLPHDVDSKAWSFDGSCSPGVPHGIQPNHVATPAPAATPAPPAPAAVATVAAPVPDPTPNKKDDDDHHHKDDDHRGIDDHHHGDSHQSNDHETGHGNH
jgi:outer membrane immunogenic protein